MKTVANLLARVAELESALRPFAAIAPTFANRRPEVRLLSAAGGDVTVANLLRARVALMGSEEEGGAWCERCKARVIAINDGDLLCPRCHLVL